MPARLDLVIKYRFFRHLSTYEDPDSERVYRWHILARTGGIEPRSWKRSVDDYVQAARDLHRSMGNGWRGNPPQIGSNGHLHDGAHRIACAASWHYASIPLLTWIGPCNSRPWDSTWMNEHGMPWPDLARTFKDWKDIAESDHHHARWDGAPKDVG